MATLDDLATFFGWCTVMHVVLYAFAAIVLGAARTPIQRLHARLFGLPEAELGGLYFRWLAFYKVMILVFAFAPYVAVCLMRDT